MVEITLDKYLNNFKLSTDFPSLDGTLYLLNTLDNPHQKLKFVHVAGTNGKGSITEMLNKVLINSGYKVGKFISPHLKLANESICINNIPIENDIVPYYVNLFTKAEKQFIKEYNRGFTRFEITTALAIDYFYKQNCDIVILEVGLGGLYDCTNVVHPIVSAFGSISFDHMQVLGNTLEEIAYQKAGIIKENSNSVIFNQEACNVIKKVATEKNNNLRIINQDEISNYSFDESYQYFTYKNNNYKINLKGIKQVENTCVVLNIIDILKENNFNLIYDTIFDSLSKITHPGRFEIIHNNPKVIFDGAHNENAIDNLINIINSLYKNDKKTFIISIIRTKEYKNILDKLYSNFKDATFILTSGNDEHKFFSNKELISYKPYENLNIKTDEIYNIKEIINKDKNSIYFTIGSFYVYKTIIDLFLKK